MSTRSERRRIAKQESKGLKRITRHVASENPGIPIDDVRIRIEMIHAKLDEMYREDAKRLRDFTADELTRQLYKAECYMQFGMILISLQAIRMAFGDLKTLPKRVQAFMDSLTPALEYIDSKGIRESYEEPTELFGLDIELEEFDINTIVDNAAGIDAVVYRLWEKRKPEIEELLKDARFD